MRATQRGCVMDSAATTGSRFLGFVSFGLTCLLLLMGISPAAKATTSAGISGVVTDQTGASVVGATVEAKAVDTGITE